MFLVDRLLGNSLVYRLWQAPFVEDKLAPLRRHNDLASVRSVLDVGCGPGTNTAAFPGTRYLGIDLNEGYVNLARARFGRPFLVADATRFHPEGERYDFILANSLLHHLNDAGVTSMFGNLKGLLTQDGHIHVVDLVLPSRWGAPRALALLDRGDHPRAHGHVKALFERFFDVAAEERFALTLAGQPLWEMVYLKGRART
jgi:SAM-dependent methyltransferase